MTDAPVPPGPPRRRDLVWFALTVLVVVGSTGAAYAVTAVQGWPRWLLLALHLALTGLAFGVPQVRAMRAQGRELSAVDREVRARAETRAAVNDALDPILRQLGGISAEPDRAVREQLIAQAVPFVLNAASSLIGEERSRSCWFELTDETPPRLVPILHVGRTGSPTTTFVTGTPAGDAAIGMVLAGENLLCRDIEADPPPGWDFSKARDYRTFISVSVIAGQNAYGMLTLDALDAGALTNDDLHLLNLMASALAAALAQCA
ncbi:GAF domain-containing protein [Nocardioides lijunqiniae]|uniref:GAF domain-containing protein n=1 Tax=Nocardioides lijunqiniae TaxID=2760832 RepID=UPI001877F222